MAGVDDDEVYTIPLGDLAVVTGSTACADYRGMTRQDAVRYLVIHQRVIEAVLSNYPILPVKFGTVLADEDCARRLLVQGSVLFRATLRRLSRQVQMEVVVLWNPQEVFAEISLEEPIVQLKAQIAGRSPEATEADRVALGQMVFASLERRRNTIRDRVLPSLHKVASDMVTNPLMDESMVLNVAVLMDKADTGSLCKQLELLDQEFGGRLKLRCVGPLPPYTFATVQVQVPSFEVVDEARRRLGLGAVVTAGEIKKAYHRLAEQMHPDRNSHDPQAEARMNALTQAYQLLIAYAASQSLELPDAKCSLEWDAVEQALLIDIRRQESPS